MSSLAGHTILLTRSREDSSRWSTELKTLGAATIELPCIEEEFLADDRLADRLSEQMTSDAWLILTSRRGVDALEQLGLTERAARMRIAVVGSQTADRARELLERCDFVGSGTSAKLGDELIGRGLLGAGDTTILAVAEAAGTALEDRLDAAGVGWHRFNTYRTTPVARRDPPLSLTELAVTEVLFASPGAVTGFLNQVRVDCAARCYSIGPTTSRAMVKAGLALTGEAREPSLSAIVELLEDSIHA